MTASSGEGASATLHAFYPGLLAPIRTRETVVAAAYGIAERTGVELKDVHADDDCLTVKVHGSLLIAMALLAELRRSTEQWHESHGEGPLWKQDADQAEPDA